ncbi:YceI family protein [Polaribacter glomeratus]|nr:YceI family protein [Polaribacter glomeratus]TXD66358.1 YceI family protein [Polaribacter glomeratus]
MKNLQNIGLTFIFLTSIILVISCTKSNAATTKKEVESAIKIAQKQTMNLFVTHGHCSTPFTGNVTDLNIDIPVRLDFGNPLENMKISFDLDPNSFMVCKGEDVTQKIKTPGLFINEKNEKITFRTTQVFTMGIDWYQVNGIMSIKGIEKEVQLLVTGIRNPNETKTHLLILQGQVNLLDWGIDYDLIVNGESLDVPTKMLHLNMTIKIS